MDETAAALQQLSRKLDTLGTDFHLQSETLTRLNLTTARLLKLLDGDPQEDIQGLRPRVRALETQMNAFPSDVPTQLTKLREDVKTLQDEVTAWKNRYLGAKWVATALGLTSVGTLGIVARLLFGGH